MSRGFGLYLFTALLLLVIICPILISQFYISDVDPSTYAIMPLLMLPFFALFMLKEKDNLRPQIDRKSIALGVIVFVAFVVLVLGLHSLLGPLFFSYRIDILLIPIAIAALAILIFGTSNLGKFVWIGLYALFASPIMLYPLVTANLGFASLNTLAIFYPAKLIFGGLTYSAPITLYLNGQGVSIGNTCIGIGALIGLAMLLIPIAYLLEGSKRSKVLWIAGGIVMLLVLNYLRMLAITLAWFFYGPSQSILDVHSIAGQIIFYLTLVVIVLLAGRFGLWYPRSRTTKSGYKYNNAGIAAAAILSIFALLVSLSYLGAAIIPITTLAQNPTFNINSPSQLYSSYISYNGTPYSALGNGNDSLAIVLQNGTGRNMPAVFLFAQQNSSAEYNVTANASIGGWKEYLADGNPAYVRTFAGNSSSYIYYSKVPYMQGGSYYVIDMYAIAGSSSATQCLSGYNLFYDTITNIAGLNINAFNSKIDADYCAISRDVK